MGFFRDLFGSLTETLFEPRCTACDAPGTPFCGRCALGLEPVGSPMCARCGLPFPDAGADRLCAVCVRRPPAFARARAAYLYGGPLEEAIQRMKYGRRPELAADLARLLRATLPPPADLVVPVPLHPRRLAERGFNPAVLLFRPWARDLRLPFAPRLLRRLRPTPAQAGLGLVERRRNVRGAFAARRRVDGLRLVLVDDVMTTGSTAHACAVALRRAGARSVVVLTLARVGLD